MNDVCNTLLENATLVFQSEKGIKDKKGSAATNLITVLVFICAICVLAIYKRLLFLDMLGLKTNMHINNVLALKIKTSNL